MNKIWGLESVTTLNVKNIFRDTIQGYKNTDIENPNEIEICPLLGYYAAVCGCCVPWFGVKVWGPAGMGK
jgi:hypothetical protein